MQSFIQTGEGGKCQAELEVQISGTENQSWVDIRSETEGEREKVSQGTVVVFLVKPSCANRMNFVVVACYSVARKENKISWGQNHLDPQGWMFNKFAQRGATEVLFNMLRCATSLVLFLQGTTPLQRLHGLPTEAVDVQCFGAWYKMKLNLTHQDFLRLFKYVRITFPAKFLEGLLKLVSWVFCMCT